MKIFGFLVVLGNFQHVNAGSILPVLPKRYQGQPAGAQGVAGSASGRLLPNTRKNATSQNDEKPAIPCGTRVCGFYFFGGEWLETGLFVTKNIQNGQKSTVFIQKILKEKIPP